MKKQYRIAYMTLILLTAVYITVMIRTVKQFKADEFPELDIQSITNGEFSDALEEYLKQNIGFRDNLFHLKSRTDLIIGEKMIQGVYVTEERLMKKQFSKGSGSAEQINAFYQEYKIPTYLILVPSAAGIYESSLPANALNINQEKLIRAVYSDTGTGIRCVDAYPILSSLKDSYIYYRTDSHWTSYGAYYVYQSAIQKMGFTPVSYQKYVISHLSTEFRGDLYQKTLYDEIKPDVLDCYTNETGSKIIEITEYHQDGKMKRRSELYDRSALASEDMYRFYLGEPCERLVIRTDLDNDKKLLLYKDDFGDCMIPFLLQHYSEICIVNLEDMYIQEDVHPEEYTQVMFLSSMEKWQEIFP